MQERIPPLQNRVGSKRSPSPWILLFILLFFLGMLLILLLRSPLMKIQHITIKGNHVLPTKVVRQTVQAHRGQAYFLVHEQELEQKIRRLPAIHSVEVSKQFPNQIQIHVHEYPVLAYVERSDRSLVPVLANGQLVDQYPQSSGNSLLPVLLPGEMTSAVRQAIQQLAQLPSSIRKTIKDIEAQGERPELVVLTTHHQHRLVVRANEVKSKLLLYPSFQKHPPGTLYLLSSIWFEKEPLQDGSK